MNSGRWKVDSGGDWPLAAQAAGAGLELVVAAALERSGLSVGEARLGGALWADPRGWRAELNAGGERQALEAEFERGHHLLARLAEAAAQALGGTLNESALRGFEDLATPSPGALLAYLAGLGSEPPERQRQWTRAFELDPALAAARLGLAQLALLQPHGGAAAAELVRGIAVQDAAAAAELGLGLWAAGEAQAAHAMLEVAARA
ncbi:MAG: hypothetical protein ACRD1E_09455, partial [Terriglobales bacterium]